MNAADIAREIRRQLPPERFAELLDQLPPSAKAKIKRLFAEKPARLIIRIRK